MLYSYSLLHVIIVSAEHFKHIMASDCEYGIPLRVVPYTVSIPGFGCDWAFNIAYGASGNICAPPHYAKSCHAFLTHIIYVAIA